MTCSIKVIECMRDKRCRHVYTGYLKDDKQTRVYACRLHQLFKKEDIFSSRSGYYYSIVPENLIRFIGELQTGSMERRCVLFNHHKRNFWFTRVGYLRDNRDRYVYSCSRHGTLVVGRPMSEIIYTIGRRQTQYYDIVPSDGVILTTEQNNNSEPFDALED